MVGLEKLGFKPMFFDSKLGVLSTPLLCFPKCCWSVTNRLYVSLLVVSYRCFSFLTCHGGVFHVNSSCVLTRLNGVVQVQRGALRAARVVNKQGVGCWYLTQSPHWWSELNSLREARVPGSAKLLHTVRRLPNAVDGISLEAAERGFLWWHLKKISSLGVLVMNYGWKIKTAEHLVKHET